MKVLILVGTALAATVTARPASTDAVNGHRFHAASGGHLSIDGPARR